MTPKNTTHLNSEVLFFLIEVIRQSMAFNLNKNESIVMNGGKDNTNGAS
jgi:hypothetical protein